MLSDKIKFIKISKFIKELRIQKNISQEVLSKKTNLSRSYIGALEIGKYNPKKDTLDNILNTLEFNQKEFDGGLIDNKGRLVRIFSNNIDVATIKNEYEKNKDINNVTPLTKHIYNNIKELDPDIDNRDISIIANLVYQYLNENIEKMIQEEVKKQVKELFNNISDEL